MSDNKINDTNCNNDINDNHTDKDYNNFVSNIFFSIKNLMSDRCFVQKKLIFCFINIENLISQKLLIIGRTYMQNKKKMYYWC